LQRKLAKEQRELSDGKSKASGRKLEEYGTHAENILSLFLGRRRTLTTSLTKRRLSVEADANVQATEAEIKDLEVQIAELSKEAQGLVTDIDQRWDALAQAINQIPLQPSRSDVYVSLFGIAWLPYHRVDVGGREVELPAFN
jgi:chromosome segregation ATPase